MAAALPLDECAKNFGTDGTKLRRTLVPRPLLRLLNGVRQPSVPGIFVS